MIDGLLLDTHIALWLDSGDERLRAPTRSLIDRRRREGGTIFLSAVSVWEIAQLVDLRRVVLDLPPRQWAERFIGRPGVEAATLDWSAASIAYGFEPLEHRDPADRLLIATAIELGCAMVTYDARIIDFGERFGRSHGFVVDNG